MLCYDHDDVVLLPCWYVVYSNMYVVVPPSSLGFVVLVQCTNV